MALASHSRFREMSEVWFAKIQGRRADSTPDAYATCLKKQVLPKLGELRLIECTVARLGISFAGPESARKRVQLQDGSYAQRPAHAANTRRMIRAIVSVVPKTPTSPATMIRSLDGETDWSRKHGTHPTLLHAAIATFVHAATGVG